MKDIYSKPYFENWLNVAGQITKEWFTKEIEYLKKNIKPNSKILDVGCGFGRHIQLLAKFSKEVTGIDNNESMIKKAKLNLYNFKNVKLFIQDATNLNFPDNYFDYVICMTNTFGNLRELKLKALNEMKRVCSKDGKIILSVYSENAIEFRKKDYEKAGVKIDNIENGIIHIKEGLITEQFTKIQLKELFQKTKLKGKILELNQISYICELRK